MIIHSEQEMLDFGKSFAKQKPQVIELIGDVGAGKTTFVRGLAEGLGAKTSVTSPSFTISKSYALPSGGRLIHYDFYRLPDPGLMVEDLRENLADPTNIIVIEWSNSVSDILPKDRVVLEIKKQDDDSREVIVKNSRSSTSRELPEVTTEDEDFESVTTGATKRVEKGIFRLFLDTSNSETVLRLNDKEYRHDFGHDLAEKLLQYIHDKLKENNKNWHDITEITFMSGPGSFTGLRIGASIVNTLAHELNVPLYDHHGVKHPVIIPDYGHPANITPPKK